jgi:hypothetical protein
MSIQLYSVDQAPVWVPDWHVILSDLHNPPAWRVARVLGVGLRTVRRYNSTGQAPRAVLLALFWLTRWGRSAVHTQATNDAIVACGYVAALRSEVAQLQARVSHLAALQTGAANEPLIRGPR